jgi:hypothetical protein
MSMYDIAMANALRNRRRKVIFRGQTAGGQSTSLDFTGAMPAAYETAFVGATSYASGFPAFEDLASRFQSTAITSSKIIRRDDRGLRLEPAATNLATNPRMIGGTAATTSTLNAGLTIAIGSIVPVGVGSFLYQATTPSPHGLSDFQRVFFQTTFTCGGRTFTTAANREVTIRVVSATVFEFAYWQAATTTATSNVAVTYQFRTWTTTGTLPTGMSIVNNLASRLIRLTLATDPSSGMVPFPIGALRTFNIAGTGTDDLILTNVPVGAAQAISWSQVGGFLIRRGGASDDQSIANIGVQSVIVERDSGNAILRETVRDLMPEMTVGISLHRMRHTVVTGANCASVDIRYRFSGANFCDIDFQFREFMVSLGAHCASPVLPAWNTTGTSSTVASTCAGVAAPYALRGANYTFESKEIVNATDTIISFGSVELQAIGTSFPRDLRLTDGTNHVTLTGALRNLWPTQQLVRAAMSFGPGGLRLAVTDDFSGAVGFGSNPTFTGSAPTTVNLNEAAGALRRGMSTAKGLVLLDTERDNAAVTAAARLTSGRSYAVPAVDTPVGRTSVAGLIPPASVSGGRLTVSAGRVFVQVAASGTVIEDVDFRGAYILSNVASVTNVTFSNCLFDLSAVDTVPTITFAISQTGLTTCTGWVFENCTFSVGTVNGTAGIQAFYSLTSAGCAVRRCRFVGSPSDLVKLLNAGTIEDCEMLMTNETAVGAHADGITLGPSSTDAQIVRRIALDYRKRVGQRIEPNYGLGGWPALNANNFTLPTTIENVDILGGFSSIAMITAAPSTSSATLPGLYIGDAQHTVSGVRIGMSPSVPALVRLNGAQLRFVGAAITIVNTAGRAGWQNGLGLMVGTWPDGFRAGSIMLASLTDPPTLASALNALSTPPAANEAITINGQSFTIRASGAVGDNEINLTDTFATLITKLQAILPGVTVTLEPYRYTAGGITDYFTGAVLA